MSRAFICDLPDISEDVLAKIYTWGKNQCERFDVHKIPEGGYQLIAIRKKASSLRQTQRLMRTNLLGWGAALPKNGPPGWLRLMPEGVGCKTPEPPTSNEANPSDDDNERCNEDGYVSGDARRMTSEEIRDASAAKIGNTAPCDEEDFGRSCGIVARQESCFGSWRTTSPSGLTWLPKNLLRNDGAAFALLHEGIDVR